MGVYYRFVMVVGMERWFIARVLVYVSASGRPHHYSVALPWLRRTGKNLSQQRYLLKNGQIMAESEKVHGVANTQLILETIDQLRKRKARPDKERICHMLQRRHGVSLEATASDLEALVDLEIVVKGLFLSNVPFIRFQVIDIPDLCCRGSVFILRNYLNVCSNFLNALRMWCRIMSVCF